MAKFVIVVTKALEQSYSAFKFAEAIIQGKQHSISAIYFFQQGVTCANSKIDLPSDEPNLQLSWQKLATLRSPNVDLICCTSSALRRGVTEPMLAAGFKLGSMAQLMLACETADKVVQF